MAKEGGWDEYKYLTKKYAQKIEEAIEEGRDIEEKMKKFDKIHNKIKFKAFGRITVGRKPKEVEKETQKTHSKEDIAKKIFEEEVERTAMEINEIKKLKTSKVGRIWDIRKRIIGGRKATLQATAIMNPKNGKLAVSKDQIKSVTLQYCQETLANNKPAIGFEGVMHTKKTNLERNLMQCNGSFMPTKEGFQTLLKKFKLSRKQNYDFLVRSSKEFQDVVF